LWTIDLSQHDADGLSLRAHGIEVEILALCCRQRTFIGSARQYDRVAGLADRWRPGGGEIEGLVLLPSPLGVPGGETKRPRGGARPMATSLAGRLTCSDAVELTAAAGAARGVAAGVAVGGGRDAELGVAGESFWALVLPAALRLGGGGVRPPGSP